MDFSLATGAFMRMMVLLFLFISPRTMVQGNSIDAGWAELGAETGDIAAPRSAAKLPKMGELDEMVRGLKLDQLPGATDA